MSNQNDNSIAVLTSYTQKSEPQNTINPALGQSYVDEWKKGLFQLVPSTFANPSSNQLPINSFSFSITDFQDLVALIDTFNKNTLPSSDKIEDVNCRIGLKPDPTNPGSFTPYMYFEPIIGGLDGELKPTVINEYGTLVSAC